MGRNSLFNVFFEKHKSCKFVLQIMISEEIKSCRQANHKTNDLLRMIWRKRRDYSLTLRDLNCNGNSLMT